MGEKEFKVYVMMGIPGSGKSTYATTHQSELPIISRDIIRIELGFCKPNEKYKGTRDEERLVTEYENALIKTYCLKKQSFIVDDMNIGRWRPSLIDKLKDHNAYIVFVKMDTPLEVCVERRKGQIDANTLEKMYDSIIEPSKDEYDEMIIATGTE